MSKAEQIRERFRSGQNIADISSELGVSHQYAHSVLKKAELLPANKPRASKTDTQEYSKFVDDLELLAVNLSEISAKVKNAPSPKGKKSAAIQLSPIDPQEIPQGFQTGLSLRVRLLDDEREFGQVAIKLIADYRSPTFPESSLFRTFSQRNLPLNLWPHFRFYVEFITSQMGLAKLTLPLYKV